MAPPPIKSVTQTLTNSSQDARLLVCETLRISANLASPDLPALPAATASFVASPSSRLELAQPLLQDQFLDSTYRLICCEQIDGRRWNYVAQIQTHPDSSFSFKKGSIRALSLHSPISPADELMSFVRSYVVPEGFGLLFPNSRLSPLQ